MPGLDRLEDWQHAHPDLNAWLSLAGVLIFAVLSFWLTRRFLLRGLRRVARRTSVRWDEVLVEHGLFDRIALIAPAIVLYNFHHLYPASDITQRVLITVVVLLVMLALSELLGAVNEVYGRLQAIRMRPPIKSYVQIAKLLIYLFGGVVIISELLDRSPLYILSGLGAVAAVGLVVFRDTLLSFVASIQIAANDLIRLGDWIELPQFGAEGLVVDVALHTVKVRNADRTITTIPTHKLLDGAFKNFRGIDETRGRLIKRSVLIDQRSVSIAGPEMLGRFEQIALVAEFVKAQRVAIDAENARSASDASVPANGRRITNLGVFRAYLESYLRGHARIRTDLPLIVRHLQPKPEGLPLEVFAFTNDPSWETSEAIQADLLDHILGVLPEFGLRVAQVSS
jgi:miniconductance mechanosensitive channel